MARGAQLPFRRERGKPVRIIVMRCWTIVVGGRGRGVYEDGDDVVVVLGCQFSQPATCNKREMVDDFDLFKNV